MCFLCNETGHLARQCPKNSQGIYINGGACKNASGGAYALDERDDDNLDLATWAARAALLAQSQSEYEQLFCKAHAHGARILTNGYKNWAGVTCPVNQFYGWAMRKNPIIYNETAMRGWAAETAAW